MPAEKNLEDFPVVLCYVSATPGENGSEDFVISVQPYFARRTDTHYVLMWNNAHIKLETVMAAHSLCEDTEHLMRFTYCEESQIEEAVAMLTNALNNIAADWISHYQKLQMTLRNPIINYSANPNAGRP